MTGENMRNFIKIVEENSKRQINELFKNEPYEYSFSNNGGNIVASFDGKNSSYEVIFDKEDDGEYTASFVTVDNRDGYDKHEPSGKGDQFNVISTIMQHILLDFMKTYKPSYLGFSGSNLDGHGKLYKAVISRLKSDISSLGYQTSIDSDGESTRFSFIKDDDDMNEDTITSMRKIMQITEAGLLPDAPRMIRIDPDVYKLMRALLFIANPEAYQNNNSHDDAGMMVFGDDITYKETTEKLKAFGIPFKEDTKKDIETNDGELMPHTDWAVSPYPGNQNSKKPAVKKKKITPNPYRDGR